MAKRRTPVDTLLGEVCPAGPADMALRSYLAKAYGSTPRAIEGHGICWQCQAEFARKSLLAKFCCDQCRWDWNNRRRLQARRRQRVVERRTTKRDRRQVWQVLWEEEGREEEAP